LSTLWREVALMKEGAPMEAAGPAARGGTPHENRPEIRNFQHRQRHVSPECDACLHSGGALYRVYA